MPESIHRPRIVNRVIAVEGGLILLAWAVARILDRPLLETIVLDWEGILAGLLATVPPCAAMVWSTRTPMPPFPRVRRDIERLVIPLFRGISPRDMVLIALLAGVGEELFFRGLLQVGLAGWIGPWRALLLVSVLFGALHWVTPTYAFLAGVIGLYLGGFMLASGNLIVPIMVHALYDYFALRYLVGRARTIAGGIGPANKAGDGGAREGPVGPGRDGAAAPGSPPPGAGS